ncbi:MAG TPA: alpha/beta hydrolase [Acidimicrobiales bacterium]|nr:alpha/beta hydrolase [Acidimicrobiales bacterium]
MHGARRAKAHKRAAFPKDHDLTVSDGTRIAYTVRGDGPGMPVVFVNGWSCTDCYWTTIGPAVAAAGHQTIFLDMRGHGESGLPRRPGIAARDLRAENVAPERLAADIVEVLDDAGVERAVLVGHSMGVQVIVETCRVAPERVAGLVPIAGTFENPVKTFADKPVLDRLYPIADVIFRFVPFEGIRPVLRRTVRPRLGRRIIQGIGVGGPNVQEKDIASHIAHFGEVNISVLFKMMSGLRRHHTAEFLPQIAVPTLVLAGRRDHFTPASVQQRMADLIPDNELIWFDDAGHLLPIEAPDEVAAAIVDFLARRAITPPRCAVQAPGRSDEGIPQ